jgi:hypothetical protein
MAYSASSGLDFRSLAQSYSGLDGQLHDPRPVNSDDLATFHRINVRPECIFGHLAGSAGTHQRSKSVGNNCVPNRRGAINTPPSQSYSERCSLLRTRRLLFFGGFSHFAFRLHAVEYGGRAADKNKM